MTSSQAIDAAQFRRILTRNIAVPLGIGIVSAGLFVGVILYLLSVLGMVEHTDRVIAQANQLQRLSVDQETAMRGFLISGQESFLAPYEVAKPKMKVDMASLRAFVSDNPTQVNRLDRIGALQEQWDLYANDVITQRRAGKELSEIVRTGRGKRLTDEIREQFDDLITMEDRLRVQRNETANAVIGWTVGGYLLFSLVVASLLAWLGRRELLGLSASYGKALAQQAAHADYLQGQSWLREGQSQLAEALVGQQSLEAAGRNALGFMAGYLGSAVGAIYARESDGRFRRVATWGFADDGIDWGQSFASAHSLVNETAERREIMALADLPSSYLKVTSGLGQGAPVSLLLAPLTHDGRVNAVVELGFVRALQPRDSELLRMIEGNLGAAVEAARYRERLQDALEETQQLNEELQVQQEELRTANEELEEQSRALKESQTHLQNQQAELEQTNEQLSEQATQLEQQRDVLDQRNAALHAAQEELEKRSDEIQRASRYKSEFLANMSHELRTPLNSSLILAKLLADNAQGNLTAEQVKFADSIYSAGNDLLNLINDILDISKVEAGKLDVRPEPASLARLVGSVEMLFRPLAANKRLQFEVELAPGLPETLVTDRQRVEQILKNLLSNAVKFTDRGAVSLRVTPTVQNGAAGVAFSVQDSGIGIDPAQHELIFEAFQQADSGTSRRYGGTGLGLSISRTLAGLLGGSIALMSTPGQGSTFTLVLPTVWDAEQAAQAAQAAAAAPGQAPAVAGTPAQAQPAALHAGAVRAGAAPGGGSARGATSAAERSRASGLPPFPDDRDVPAAPGSRCVLVVEDEPQFARILFDLAHELGYRCLVAHHADEGCELAEQHQPDAVLLDMRLPDGSGLTVLQHLKETPSTRHIPVHVISVEDRAEAALQLGAIGYAVKPATRDQLKEVFQRLEAKLAQKVKRVLLVEDDAVQRDAVTRLIGDADTEIVAVEFGEQALQALRDSVFDCMIIDLTLPDMPGAQLLKRMASEEIRSFPPVIVYTGRNLTRNEEAELLRYSRSIIIKGARSPERLLDEVTLFLHRVETDLSSEHQKMLRTARSRDKVFEGRRILVVDDDVRNIFAMTSALEQKGAVVEIARNGREALEKLEAVADVDLVLMDVMMPEMDGYTATREIRKQRRWQKLPIIAVTAKAMKDDQARCLEAGANDYLAKPVELERLFSLMRVWLPKMERV
jgi:CheY-like chemotaxis protein/signal transduction histidine kinase/CHASE3 domain sensor protein